MIERRLVVGKKLGTNVQQNRYIPPIRTVTPASLFVELYAFCRLLPVLYCNCNTTPCINNLAAQRLMNNSTVQALR